MALAYLGLGSNLGDRMDNLRRAVAALDGIDGVVPYRGSPVYETPPWGYEDQPPFYNAAAAVYTSLSPEELLRACLTVEADLGRRRDAADDSDSSPAKRWGPRPIDIDLLLYDRESLDTAELTLPHPRMEERLFVLEPLADLAPERRLPSGETVAAARDRLRATGDEGTAGGLHVVGALDPERRHLPGPAAVDGEAVDLPEPWQAVSYGRITSTMDRAQAFAAAGAPAGLVVHARAQTAGRGRRQRDWDSPGGQGLWTSWLLRPRDVPAGRAGQLPLVVSVAVAEMLAACDEGPRPRLKWPNDILFDGGKTAGILVDGATNEGPGGGFRLSRAVIGIGINVNQTAADFHPEVRDRAASLRTATGRRRTPETLLEPLARALNRWLPVWDQGDFAEVLAVWRRFDAVLGRQVTLIESEERRRVRAVDIAGDGALIVDDGSGTETVRAADVSLRR